MKLFRFLLTLTGIAACFAASAANPALIRWTTLGNGVDGEGKAQYVQRFEISGDIDFNKFCFNQFARGMRPVEDVVSLREIVPGYYEVDFSRLQPKDGKITVDIATRGNMQAICYAPDGVHKVMADGSPAPVEYVTGSIIEFPAQWSTAKSNWMPKAEKIFARNEELRNISPTYNASAPYNLLPTFKQVKLTGGKFKKKAGSAPKIEFKANAALGDTLRISVTKGKIKAESGNKELASERAKRLAVHLAPFAQVEEAEIFDYPDYQYRGIMIDVARNFLTIGEMKRLVDEMARYGMNVLHFHLVDDEAWRLEIPGLPELTDLGSRRGYTNDETEYLAQIFCGDGNPDNLSNTSNGYYTREQFIDFLKYANSKGVAILPEIEAPGHARAAIKAMQKRARGGDDSYLLSELVGDTSKYTSAQAFHDNVMNPALPGPYKFMGKVADEVVKMYAEAGAPLLAIHIGGDEVPRGSWSGSPAAQKLMADQKMTHQKELHAYFVEKIAEVMRPVKISGWSEIAVGHSDAYDAAVAPSVYSVNCWHGTSDKPESEVRQALKRGYPVILSNVDRLYLDQWYTSHPMERGLTWGGIVDEYRTLSSTADKFSKPYDTDKGSIIGISGQLWGETLRSAAGMQNLVFPKMLGLAERAWNADATLSEPEYTAIISEVEIPHWIERGITFHVPQPGIRLNDEGLAEINAPYNKIGEIRYTLDGSDPTPSSPLYTSPLKLADNQQLRAVYFINTIPSVTTIFNY